MKLVYFRGKQLNFGDDLNGVLWPRLLPDLFDDMGAEGFLGIGTLIGMATPGCLRLHVFSTGAGYDAVDTWRTERKVWCVRGPITAKLLGVDAALTDGAILTPEIMGPPPGDPTGRIVGVVPHWQSLHFPGWEVACRAAGFRLISPIDTPERVHAAIGSVSLVLTESLHGAIFADTMGIPWVPFVTTRNVSALKWVDWCLSVGVAFTPVPLPPPSAAAALAFGRPGGGDGKAPLRFDAEAAMTEFRQRVAMHAVVSLAAPQHHARAQAAPGLAARMRAGLQEAAQRSPAVSRALGYSPARTAARLAAAARLEPKLSAASRRADLRSAMLERLSAFERSQRTVEPRGVPTGVSSGVSGGFPSGIPGDVTAGVER
jgi:succinoglycan biosynthesis protein ExoV